MGKSVRKSRKPKPTSLWADVSQAVDTPGDSTQASQPGYDADPVAHGGSTTGKARDRVDDRGTEHTPNVQRQNPRTTTYRYPKDVKQRVVAAMLATDREHPYTDACVDAACSVLGHEINRGTLHEWIQDYGDEIRALLPDPLSEREIVTSTYNEVRAKWESLRNLYMEHLSNPAVVALARPMESNAVVGTAQDKLDRMMGISSDHLMLFQRLVKACDIKALDVNEVVTKIIQYVLSLKFEDTPQAITPQSTIQVEEALPQDDNVIPGEIGQDSA